MEIKKVNLDRQQVGSDYIRSRQDFEYILKAHRSSTNPVWKQPLFYGVVGFATIASAFFVSLFELNELEMNIVSEEKPQFDGYSVAVAQNNNIGNYFASPLALEPSTNHFANVKVAGAEQNRADLPTSMGIANDNAEVSKAMNHHSTDGDDKGNSMPTPYIAGIQEGTLNTRQLCDNSGIRTNLHSVEVSTFTIQYFDGVDDQVVQIEGSKIPQHVCQTIEKSGGAQLVFITNVWAKDLEGEVKLPSMNFWVEREG
jgi:hypothetical protein